VDAALFSPQDFEPLTDEGWDARRVRAAIRSLVADAEQAFDAVDLWPVADDWDSDGGSAQLPLTRLYSGASGVVWALERLRRRGHADTGVDPPGRGAAYPRGMAAGARRA
jgi:hypothetical protein